MKTSVITWTGGMSFEAHTDTNHVIVMDAKPEVGGEDKGPRPTDLLVAALGGCTGMDIVSILKKQRVTIDRFDIGIEADSAEEHPKSFKAFRLTYYLWSPDATAEKFKRAVELSESTYCSVGGLYKKGASISYKLQLNDEPVE
ncbi:MAG TPA: OsmC family protein [Symbiobacteriaceae bacterium]|jgi:putative redox protein